MKAKIATFAISAMLVLGCAVNVNAATLSTSGGKVNKNWTTTISKTSYGGAFYRITGEGHQPSLYKFDNVALTVIHFCNANNNVVKSVTSRNTYQISACADAGYGSSASRGSSCLTVKDNTYGQGTITIYYN